MKFGQTNIGILERVIRILLGGFLITVAATYISGPWSLWSWLLLLIGGILFITGVIGTCPLYTILGISTAENG
ncbi:MAG: DUF2892 domain-containing protein [Methanomicrobiales archaeon]